MPSRLLREGIIDSEAVNALSFPAEVFYRRLMSVVDDFGRFDGRPAVLRSRLYPLKVELVREADISRWIAECEKAGLIALYAVNRAGSSRWIATCEKAGLHVSGDLDKVFIQFGKLGSPRAKESKFPPPPDELHPFTSANGCAQMKTDENGCAHPFSSVPGSYSGSGAGSYSGSGAVSAEPAKPAPTTTPRKTFTPPTIEEVRAYCLERNRGIDPEKWLDHYSANGWRVGPNPMKDWRAAVRTWERNEGKYSTGAKAVPGGAVVETIQDFIDRHTPEAEK